MILIERKHIEAEISEARLIDVTSGSLVIDIDDPSSDNVSYIIDEEVSS